MITTEERRARLAERHHLLPRTRVDDLPRIADDLVGLHSSDPVTVYLSALGRMQHPDLAAVEAALYEDRSLIRHHAMRRTLWVATPEVVRLMHAAATRALLAPETKRTAGMLSESGVADPVAWLDDARAQLLADLGQHGPSAAKTIGERLPALRQPLTLSAGKPYAGVQSAHTRVLLLLGFAGEVVRTRPSGSWISGAYRYAASGSWLPGGLGTEDRRPAAAALADRWLQRFGPATSIDLQWWMGWNQRATREALADCGAVSVDLDSGPAWVAAADGPTPAAEPWVAALPSLDPTTMGWKQRDWYLPAAAAEAFDTMGNSGPTLWVDGRVVGVWGQRRTGELVTHYFEQVAAPRRAEISERLAALRRAVGHTRFSVRFPGLVHPGLVAG